MGSHVKKFERSNCWAVEIMHGFFGAVYAKKISWPKLYLIDFDWMKHIIHNTFSQNQSSQA